MEEGDERTKMKCKMEGPQNLTKIPRTGFFINFKVLVTNHYPSKPEPGCHPQCTLGIIVWFGDDRRRDRRALAVLIVMGWMDGWMRDLSFDWGLTYSPVRKRTLIDGYSGTE